MVHTEKTASEELEQWKANFEKEMAEHVREMNQIVREAEKQKDFIAIFDHKVKAWGGSAHVQIPKKYVGHGVRILILKNKVNGDKKHGNK